MSKRRNHDAAFKARVAIEAVKGARTVSEFAAEYGVQLFTNPVQGVRIITSSRIDHKAASSDRR